MYDHLTPFWMPSQRSFEAWTLLSAVASHTTRIRVGTLVTNVNFRNPGLLAKMATTVDNISDGRLIVGLGIGDKMSIKELRSYGYQFPPLDERITRLRETIQILRALWSGRPAVVQGKTYRISNAICLPKPKQENGPPIWIGGRHRRLVDAAAEFADGWNHWNLPVGKVLELEGLLSERCAELDRDPDSIVESWAGTLITDSKPNLTDTIRGQVEAQMGKRTGYFIATFPENSEYRVYEAFPEAVRSIS